MAQRSPRKPPQDDALTRSRTRSPALARKQEGPGNEEEDPSTLAGELDDAELDEEDEEEEEALDENHQALAFLNEATSLSSPPLVGGKARAAQTMYGRDAMSLGAASSPRLFAQATKFPTCTQLRVWKMENGIPVGVGAIDSTASEDEFVRRFFSSMPKPGEARAAFRLRPVDIGGAELGSEFTIAISENHTELNALRAQKRQEEEKAAAGVPLFPPAAPADNSMGYEMSQVLQQLMETQDQRTRELQTTLEDERSRYRSDEEQRAQERIDLATNAAAGVQAITERMMNDENTRAERAMRTQAEQSQLLLTTLTQIFTSAQQQQSSIAETARSADQQRLEQERQYAARIQMEQEERRKRDIAEMEERRKHDQLRLEDERKQVAAAREYELKQLEHQANLRREEEKSRLEREKAEIAAKLALEQARMDRERAEAEAKLAQRALEEQKKIELEKAGLSNQAAGQRLEWEHRWKLEQEERARRDSQAKEEREARLALETARRQMELDAQSRRDAAEREERDRKAAFERELAASRQAELDRRARMEEEALKTREADRQRAHDLMVKQMEATAAKDREHAERMVSMQKEELRAQREMADARMAREREEAAAREAERVRVHERMLKEAELQAAKDKEHAERMLALQKEELKSQKEAADARLAREREEAAAREAERARVHERLLKEAELQAAKDKEHAERMMLIQQQQNQQKALGGLGDLLPKAKEFLGELNIEPMDLLQRIFQPPGAAAPPGSSWSDALPKVLETGAGMAKAFLDAQASSRQPLRPALPQPNPQMMMMQPNQQMAMLPNQQVPQMMMMQPVPGMPGMMAMVPAPVPAQQAQTAGTLPAQVISPVLPETEENQEEAAEDNTPLIPEAPGKAPTAEQEAEAEGSLVPSTTQIAQEAGLGLPVQKRARKALRELVRKLKGTNPEKWTGVASVAISNEFGIVHYVQAVTVRAALLEAGASDEFAEKIMTALRESNLIPADISLD